MLTNQNFIKVFFGNTCRKNFKSSRYKKAKLDRETGLFLFEDMTGRRFEDKRRNVLSRQDVWIRTFI